MQLLQVRTCSNPTTFPSNFVAQHKMPMRHNPNQQQHMHWLSYHEGPKNPSHTHAFGVSGTAATAAYAHTHTHIHKAWATGRSRQRAPVTGAL